MPTYNSGLKAKLGESMGASVATPNVNAKPAKTIVRTLNQIPCEVGVALLVLAELYQRVI